VGLVVLPILVDAIVGDLLHAMWVCLALPRNPASVCQHVLIVIGIAVGVATVVAALVVAVVLLIADLGAVPGAQIGVCLKEVNRPLATFLIRFGDVPCTPCTTCTAPRIFGGPVPVRLSVSRAE